MSVITPSDLITGILKRVPDLAGIIIALVMLFTIYQAQEVRLDAITSDYHELAQFCARNVSHLLSKPRSEDIQIQANRRNDQRYSYTYE